MQTGRYTGKLTCWQVHRLGLNYVGANGSGAYMEGSELL